MNVGYRLYPDVDFPVPITDCHDVVRWLSTHYLTLSGGDRIDPSLGFILGGMSGGGTYASIVCHLARDERLLPRITGCYLACPVLSTVIVNPHTNEEKDIFPPSRNNSHTTCANAPLMNNKMQSAIKDFANYEFNDPLLSPVHFPSHEGLSRRTYTQVCGLDPWRDAGICYHEELEKAKKVGEEGDGDGDGDAGAGVRLDVFGRLPHCWWSTYPDIEATEQWWGRTVEGWRWLLGRDGDGEDDDGKAEGGKGVSMGAKL